ncbi:MAG: tRNA (adenosine(37)-N6)-threonylcarbamoyltransferase complex dimerization subunit type 1 TsaB [Jatrophihabitans sp.]
MFVLAIDTSSPAVTAGVVSVEGEVVLAAERAPLAARGHDELLAPSIADCLRDAGLATRDLAAVVAGVGPGPYTGLRVGLVTAAAFGDAVGIPTYGVCSLDAIGHACVDEDTLLVATDARRREVYWARYSYGRRTTDPTVGRPDSVPLDGVHVVAGAGGELHQDTWPTLYRRTERYPDPVALVSLALERIVSSAPSEVLEPMYLRRPDAVEPGVRKTVTQTATQRVAR